MNNDDIVFKNDNIKFNYRVAGIFEYNNKYLIQKSEKDDFYSLIGGKVKFGEKTVSALEREVMEEIGFEIPKDKTRLIRVCENFFQYSSTRYHEILFIYLIDIREDDIIEKQKSFRCVDKDTTMMLWKSEQEIEKLDLRPENSKDILKNKELKHEVIVE
ncbi:MAG: NUDIX domain-containing protein [Clostridia bacterium]|nr:NUDIX domain-containing protein [Clostridia bacterium]